MFGAESFRLLRETWKSATQLAEELYAMFQDNIPGSATTIAGPLTLTNPTAPLTIQMPNPLPNDQPTINITDQAGNQLGGFSFQGGNISVNANGGINGPATTISDVPLTMLQLTPAIQDLVNQALENQPSAAGGGGVPGQVISGTGSSYTVRIYPTGLTGASLVVPATQLQIDPAETIPAGTWTIVAQVGAKNYLQVPVWLGT